MAYISGQWNVHCPVCGFKKKSGQMRQRWDGVFVCRDDWEQRHPSDVYRFKLPAEAPLPFTYEETIPASYFEDDGDLFYYSEGDGDLHLLDV